jgi:succinate dehydrogenase/fumarate reductase cytochrome b subunit
MIPDLLLMVGGYVFLRCFQFLLQAAKDRELSMAIGSIALAVIVYVCVLHTFLSVRTAVMELPPLLNQSQILKGAGL